MHRRRSLSLGRFYYLLICFVLYLPILLLILFSFNDATALVFPLKGFTLKWYGQMLENAELLKALGNSILIGAGSSLVATLLGLGVIEHWFMVLPWHGEALWKIATDSAERPLGAGGLSRESR